MFLVACTAPASPPQTTVAVTSQLGSWQGRDNATLGFVSDSGRFRVTWEARNATAPRAARLHIVIHSAVSGRPLQEVIDQRGEGKGVFDFSDDPRSYNLMVESASIEWSITVDGTSGVYKKQ